jgi:hypothetical protein
MPVLLCRYRAIRSGILPGQHGFVQYIAVAGMPEVLVNVGWLRWRPVWRGGGVAARARMTFSK